MRLWIAQQMYVLIILICFQLRVCETISETDGSNSEIDEDDETEESNPVLFVDDDIEEDEDEYSDNFDFSSCTIEIGPGDDDIINLKPLSGGDGGPRFNSTFTVSHEDVLKVWNYVYDPCMPFTLPRSNPHNRDVVGDGCHSVSLCKFGNQSLRSHYYSLGVNSEDKVRVKVVNPNNVTGMAEVTLIYTGIKLQRATQTIIKLVCDKDRKSEDAGYFNVTGDNGQGVVFAELHHECCCVGGCWKDGLDSTENVSQEGEEILILAGFLTAFLMLLALIVGLCYVKRTHLRIYSKLPGISPRSPGSKASVITMDGSKLSDFRDYEPAGVNSLKRKLIPILGDSDIQLKSVAMGQRLGGGAFGDTHLAKWSEMTVTLKRLTIAIHNNQLTSETMEWMKQEVWFLSRQRHKNIVCIIGLCLDGKLPFLLTEYVIGECLKDFLKVNGQLLTWPQRVRMCSQVADGVAFLHSTSPAIIHRDLRCGNLFLSDNDLVKVADFGLTKLLQPMREQCPNDDCSCQRQLSACPARIRWTAPELLTHSCAKEGQGSVISTSCDVYSFGMVMWEMVVCKDPFAEISSEMEVIEIVRNGGRPDMPSSEDMMLQFKDLMKSCWDHEPAHRPQLKQVSAQLKDMVGAARSHQKYVNMNKQRMQKLHVQGRMGTVINL